LGLMGTVFFCRA